MSADEVEAGQEAYRAIDQLLHIYELTDSVVLGKVVQMLDQDKLGELLIAAIILRSMNK